MEKLKNFGLRIIAFLIAAVFIYAGAIKFFNPANFFVDIRNYDLFSDSFSFITAYFLPPLEIVAGIFLIFKKTQKGGAIIIALLLFVFIFAITSAWIRGLDISCGCFGGEGKSHYASVIVRDFLMLCGLTFVIFYDRKNLKYENEK